MMHQIQKDLYSLSKRHDISKMTLREMAHAIGVSEASPQKIKHHLLQLQKKGILNISQSGNQVRVNTPLWAKGLLNRSSNLFLIPILGSANCGPANIFAEENFDGFLRVSSRLLNQSNSKGIFALKADGSSMNRAEVEGKKIEDGDYVIVDSKIKNPHDNDIVLAIIDGKATIKRYIEDKKNKQIVLMADSSYDYEPIYLHPEDDFAISGKVIEILKRPTRATVSE